MDNIIFICPFNNKHSGRLLSLAPSSEVCSRYITEAIKRAGDYHVDTLSLAGSLKNYYTSSSVIIDEKETNHYFPSFSQRKSKLAIRVNQFILYLCIFNYLLFRTTRKDKIVIFHDYGFSHLYSLLRFFVPRSYFYLIGEIYNAVYDRGEAKIKREIRRLEGGAGYIYANDRMDKLFQFNKPYTVFYGAYTIDDREKIKKNDVVNIVYAGKISSGTINDAFIAADVAKYLPDNYKVYILGYGEDSDLRLLQTVCDEINRERQSMVVSYGGCLSGEEYDSFLNKCQYGLCTRALSNELSDYCFPSKVLVYMAHDMIPVCPKLSNLKNSKLAEGILFNNGIMTAENLANTIINSGEKFLAYNYKELLIKSDMCFLNGLNKLFN